MLIKKIKDMLCWIVFTLVLITVASCSSDDGYDGAPEEPVRQTVVMFYPWSTNLLKDFRRNVQDFSSVVARCGLDGERVMVFMATSQTEAVLFELSADNGKCVADTLHRYKNRSFTSRSSMASLFSEIKKLSPADRYGMVVGGHGMAWLPVDGSSAQRKAMRHYDVSAPFSTRYIGGQRADCQIETTDFAAALSDAGLKMEYILFDACYMSSVEVAYELRNATHYIVACPTEVMSYGFPYAKCGEYLLGDVDLKSVVDNFIGYYSFSSSPYATIAVTDCTQLDALAAVVRQINSFVGNVVVSVDDVQRMDGYKPSLFLDFGDYYEKKCFEQSLLPELEEQLSKTVVYKGHTDQYYSSLGGYVSITHYSGLITSEPSTNTLAAKFNETAWYKATHLEW